MDTRGAERPIPSPLITKLERIEALSPGDRQAILDASRKTRMIEARQDIISDGDRPDHVHLVLDGWAARYKVLPNGARQFTAYLIPGDFCDLHITILKEMDHGILALSTATVAYIPRDQMRAIIDDRPDLTRALWWATLVDEGVLRAWIVNMGRRNARERIAHLMCEMHVRMNNIGLVTDDEFDFPLTQDELADTLGLTPVHVNRMLQSLRRKGLIEFGGKRLRLPDVAAIRHLAGFDPNYLHADHLRD
jgi:CRP-like cAMP-binding protein